MITAYKACSSQLRVNIEKNPQNRCQVLLEDFRKAIAEKIWKKVCVIFFLKVIIRFKLNSNDIFSNKLRIYSTKSSLILEKEKMRKEMEEEIRAQLEANAMAMMSWDEKVS